VEADGLGGQVTRVATEAELVRALDQGGVDIVLADLTLPFVDGLAALSVTRKKHPAVGRVAIARDVFRWVPAIWAP
jgi:CheY-like chemotaxis protein